MNTIRTRFVPIGNSRGLRVPKVLIDQLGLGGEVEIAVESNRLVIQALSSPRQGWEEAFQKMNAKGDDALMDEAQPTEWDKTEWEW